MPQRLGGGSSRLGGGRLGSDRLRGGGFRPHLIDQRLQIMQQAAVDRYGDWSCLDLAAATDKADVDGAVGDGVQPCFCTAGVSILGRQVVRPQIQVGPSSGVAVGPGEPFDSRW